MSIYVVLLIILCNMTCWRASKVLATLFAIEMGATLEDLMATIHPHPTMSELWMEAAEVGAGSPVHIYVKK